ncbi:MAG: sugar ABC transporter permease [Treponema sp.]|jgi:raffinose/stachyose/melibiose transport system permease protein|nr:sugar ABC transporter permease [Treponema sp.]
MKLYNARRREIWVVSTLFTLPVTLLLLVYIYYSVGYAFFLSFHNWNGIDPVKAFVNILNWKELFQDPSFTGAVKHNLVIVIMSLVIQQPIAIGTAFMLDRIGSRSAPLKVIYYFPALFSTSAVGMLFLFIYSPRNGIFTTFSRLFGGGIVDILGNPETSLMGVFSVICWTAIPFYILFYRAVMTGISREIYEAAVIDGASLSQYFFTILLPMIKFSIQTACTLSMIGSLKYFDLIYIMTEGGPNSSSELMATYMYRMTFRFRRMGYGSSIASGMFIFVVIFSLVFLFVSNKLLRENGELS